MGHACMIGGSCFNEKGETLWGVKSKKEVSNEDDKFETIESRPQFESCMPHYRFRQWKEYYRLSWDNEGAKDDDDWWQVSKLFSMFNRRRRLAIVTYW